MPYRPSGRQLGLFDNPVSSCTLEELAGVVRELETARPGLTVAQITDAVFGEAAIKRTPRASDLVEQAVAIGRVRAPAAEVTASQRRAGTGEVRAWAARSGLRLGPGGALPGPVIAAYDQAHPDRPY